jgi:hypothetical protein
MGYAKRGIIVFPQPAVESANLGEELKARFLGRFNRLQKQKWKVSVRSRSFETNKTT